MEMGAPGKHTIQTSANWDFQGFTETEMAITELVWICSRSSAYTYGS